MSVTLLSHLVPCVGRVCNSGRMPGLGGPLMQTQVQAVPYLMSCTEL